MIPTLTAQPHSGKTFHSNTEYQDVRIKYSTRNIMTKNIIKTIYKVKTLLAICYHRVMLTIRPADDEVTSSNPAAPDSFSIIVSDIAVILKSNNS